MKVDLSVQGQPLFLSPDGLVPRTRLQDDWEGDPKDLGGGHGPWRQDQEAQGGGGGVSPALPNSTALPLQLNAHTQLLELP